jgi:hypothetical protein
MNNQETQEQAPSQEGLKLCNDTQPSTLEEEVIVDLTDLTAKTREVGEIKDTMALAIDEAMREVAEDDDKVEKRAPKRKANDEDEDDAAKQPIKSAKCEETSVAVENASNTDTSASATTVYVIHIRRDRHHEIKYFSSLEDAKRFLPLAKRLTDFPGPCDIEELRYSNIEEEIAEANEVLKEWEDGGFGDSYHNEDVEAKAD